MMAELISRPIKIKKGKIRSLKSPGAVLKRIGKKYNKGFDGSGSKFVLINYTITFR